MNGVSTRVENEFARRKTHIVFLCRGHFVARHAIGVIGSLDYIHCGNKKVGFGKHDHIGG